MVVESFLVCPTACRHKGWPFFSWIPFARKGRTLTERIERLAKETGEAAELHQQEETASRKKKAKLEVELAAVVAKYDRDMAAKTAQIEEIKVRESD